MITEQVGNRIRALRKQRGLSQEKLALKAGIDRTYLAGIETGKRNATLLSLEKVAIALDISMRDFFDFEKKLTISNKYGILLYARPPGGSLWQRKTTISTLFSHICLT